MKWLCFSSHIPQCFRSYYIPGTLPDLTAAQLILLVLKAELHHFFLGRFLSAYVFCLHLYVCSPCSCSTLWSQKRMLDSLELELKDDKPRTSACKNTKCSEMLTHLFSSYFSFHNAQECVSTSILSSLTYKLAKSSLCLAYYLIYLPYQTQHSQNTNFNKNDYLHKLEILGLLRYNYLLIIKLP